MNTTRHDEDIDATSPTWTITGALSAGRYSHTATLLDDGMVLAAGGVTDQNKIVSRVEIYNPANRRWTTNGALRVPRVAHTATLLRDNRLLLAGGRSEPAGGSINGVEVYDPTTGESSPTASLAHARQEHTATLLKNGKVLVAGGTDDSSFPDRIPTAEIYDPESETWTLTGSLTLNNGRTAHTATLLDDGTVLVVGGNTFGPLMAEGAEIYDPKSGKWEATAEPTTVRVNHTATLLPNGTVLLAGGARSNGLVDEVRTAEIYNPDVKEFSASGDFIMARQGHAATLLANGLVLATGGFMGAVAVDDVTLVFTIKDVEVYNPSTHEWSITAAMNAARSEHSATLLSDGSVLVTGGQERTVSGLSPTAGTELFSA